MNGQRRALRICGSGTALPAHATPSGELDRRFALPEGTIEARYGVRQRPTCVDENASGLAVRACIAALAGAGLDWDDIDCLVVASATMDQALPFNAAMVLGQAPGVARHIAAFDIGASCLSFIAALDTISYLIDAGRYHHVLVVSSDIATFALDWTELGEAAIFGDGAAAVVVRRSAADEPSCILASRIATFSEGTDWCHIKAGGSRHHPARCDGDFERLTRFHMDGPRLFKLVSRELPRFVASVLEHAALTMRDLRIVVPHQASRLALDHLARRLRVDPSRIVDILADHGNQVAASLPTALHHAIAGGRLARGDAFLLVGTGAGVTMGGMAMVY